MTSNAMCVVLSVLIAADLAAGTTPPVSLIKTGEGCQSSYLSLQECADDVHAALLSRPRNALFGRDTLEMCRRLRWNLVHTTVERPKPDTVPTHFPLHPLLKVEGLEGARLMRQRCGTTVPHRCRRARRSVASSGTPSRHSPRECCAQASPLRC